MEATGAYCSLVDDSPTADPAMPFLRRALDPLEAGPEIQNALARHLKAQPLRLAAVRLCRYKPQRRCLIEYELVTNGAGAANSAITLLGKARAKATDEVTFALTRQLWQSGFDNEAADGVHIPEPVGLIPAFHMYLQQKVAGRLVCDLLPEAAGAWLGRRVAEALLKLHASDVSPPRRHTMKDELNILRARLRLVARSHPHWAERVERVLAGCERLAASLTPNEPRPVHRDFYPGQVLVHGETITLLDFDLSAWGDPAVDVGNYLAHVTELSLRVAKKPEAFREHEFAFESHYRDCQPEVISKSIVIYMTLSLARHIYISTQFIDRTHLTPVLLDLCEERLGLPSK
jgi:phosphotransferase family enzyme